MQSSNIAFIPQVPEVCGFEEPSGCKSSSAFEEAYGRPAGICKENDDLQLVTGMWKPCFRPPVMLTCFPQVRFSDEKRFLLYHDGPVRVWRRDGDRFKQGCVRGTVKNRKGLMASLIIASDRRSRLIRCPDRMDSTGYQLTILRPHAAFLKGPGVVFMQDGASCHTSRSTLRFLKNQRVSLLPDWPAQSPDLNPVEHCWAWLAKQVSGQAFSTTEDLWAALQREWAAAPANLIPSLYGSMVRRLTAVQVAKGGATRY